jgi:hypothetical protein
MPAIILPKHRVATQRIPEYDVDRVQLLEPRLMVPLTQPLTGIPNNQGIVLDSQFVNKNGIFGCYVAELGPRNIITGKSFSYSNDAVFIRNRAGLGWANANADGVYTTIPMVGGAWTVVALLTTTNSAPSTSASVQIRADSSSGSILLGYGDQSGAYSNERVSCKFAGVGSSTAGPGLSTWLYGCRYNASAGTGGLYRIYYKFSAATSYDTTTNQTSSDVVKSLTSGIAHSGRSTSAGTYTFMHAILVGNKYKSNEEFIAHMNTCLDYFTLK